MVNGQLKLKDLTWQQKKELMKILEAAGKTLVRVAEDKQLPVEFVEAAFRFGIEGFEDANKLGELSFIELQEGASRVFERVFLEGEQRKKN